MPGLGGMGGPLGGAADGRWRCLGPVVDSEDPTRH